MKKKSILGLFALLFGMSVFTTSCQDMLTPNMDRYAENFSGKDTVSFYLGILQNVQGVVEQNILLNDLRSDLAQTTSYSSDTIADITNFKQLPDGDNGLLNRANYYKVINQCNFYLSKVDSMASKNGVYFMRREMAQVLLIRAWTYMQLVQQYGSVPFITEPISSANTGWENSAPKVTADNLLNHLLNDCQQALAYEKSMGVPYYKTFNNGKINFDHKNLIFPANLVLGDLYLLRGASKDDYIQASKHYYDFISDKNTPRYVTSARTSYGKSVRFVGGMLEERYEPSMGSWNVFFKDNTYTGNQPELITTIPSAAQSVFGTVLTRIPQIYGFDPSSSAQTHGGEGASTSSTTGEISVVANYKNRQIAPSARYEALTSAQVYAFKDTENKSQGNYDIKYIYSGDPRLLGTAPEVQTDEGKLRFIQKFAPNANNGVRDFYPNGFSFRYGISIYRTRQVYLRFAEALNRAGYPRHAFAILRGGLNPKYFPTLLSDTVYDDANKTKQLVYSLETDTAENSEFKAYFLNVDEQRRALADPNYSLMLDFTDERWENNSSGIHDLGAGQAELKDSLNDYGYRVAQRILDEQNRRGALTASTRKLVQKLRNESRLMADTLFVEGDTITGDALDALRSKYQELATTEPQEPTAEEIDAVECLIADECALETAFEGYRFFDLMRFARHKNNDAAGAGTSWLAWQIARRNTDLKLYESPQTYDAQLYNFLLNPDNWFIKNPEYK